MVTPLTIKKRRQSSSEVRTTSSEVRIPTSEGRTSTPDVRNPSQLGESTCVDEHQRVNNFSFSASTCLELVDKLTDNQIDHDFKRIEHKFTGRKTKKAKRDFLRAACSESTAEFLTGRETELNNVNTLLSQLNERLHSVERLSSKLDKIDDITSNLANSRCMDDILVKRSNLDSAAKISDCDRITSTPTQYPETTSPNPLTLHEQNVDINLSTFLSSTSISLHFYPLHQSLYIFILYINLSTFLSSTSISLHFYPLHQSLYIFILYINLSTFLSSTSISLHFYPLHQSL